MFTKHYCALALVFPCVLTAQETAVHVSGDVKQPLSLTAEELSKMPRASVTITARGTQTVYQGVWLHDLLKRAGVPQGSALRGKALAGYVLAQARDGYQVVFSLAEADPAFIDNEVLVADSADGNPLSAKEGPVRLVVPKDKIAARSVRMLTRLEVVQLRK